MRPNRMLVIVALVAACVLISVPAASQKTQTQQVLVVNGSGQPVPTAAQGTTNVAGTVTLGSGSTVNVGNTPNVNVSNTPSVNVTNTPTVSLAAGSGVNVTNPLDAQNNPMPLVTLEAAQPYEDECSIPLGGTDRGDCSFRTVPAGKQLVIQEFDALGGVGFGLKPIILSVGQSQNPHYFTAIYMGTANFDIFATHQETRLYVNSNQTPICSVFLTGASANGDYHCSLSGFLVDVP